MKNSAIFALLMLVVASCGQSSGGDQRLEGLWVSDKAMTLGNINQSDLSGDRLNYLNGNLGELRFLFAGNKTALLYSSEPNANPEFWIYEVTGSTQDSISIKVRNVETTYFLEGNCFYLVNLDWGYNEYFCKADGSV